MEEAQQEQIQLPPTIASAANELKKAGLSKKRPSKDAARPCRDIYARGKRSRRCELFQEGCGSARADQVHVGEIVVRALSQHPRTAINGSFRSNTRQLEAVGASGGLKTRLQCMCVALVLLWWEQQEGAREVSWIW